MRRFAYSGIRRGGCEGKLCSYPLGEPIVAASRLTSLEFFTLVEWITWWIRPSWWETSPVEGLELSYMESINFTDTGSFVMPLSAAWGPYPGGRYWGAGSRKSSFRDSLGRGMLDYLLRCHYFSRVKFS